MSRSKSRRNNAPIDKIVRVVNVLLIVTDNSGSVLSTYGGEAPELAGLLRRYASIDYSKESTPMVEKSDRVLSPLGQDIYRVTREFVLLSRSALLFFSPSDLRNLDKQLPTVANYSFVVSQ